MTATDESIARIAAELEAIYYKPSHARVALILSWEQRKHITPNLVKCRRRGMKV